MKWRVGKPTLHFLRVYLKDYFTTLIFLLGGKMNKKVTKAHGDISKLCHDHGQLWWR